MSRDNGRINERLSLETKRHVCGTPIKLIALDGDIIPGQTAIWEVEPVNKQGVIKIGVIFELYVTPEE